MGKMINRRAITISLFLVFGVTGLVNAQETSAVFNGGAVKIGYDGRTCDGSLEGSIRYNSSGPAIEYCDGTNWVSGAACGFNVGNISGFPSNNDVWESQTITSAIRLIDTDSCSADVSISGDGSPQYQICSDVTCSSVSHSWSSSAGSVDDGEYIQMRLTSAGAPDTTNTATLLVGDLIFEWNVSTALDGMLVFVTSTTSTGAMNGIGGADRTCMNLADAAGLVNSSTVFRAWLAGSAASTAPASRFTQSSLQYKMVNGTKIADNWSDLTDGSIDAIIDRDENGTQQTAASVFTNVTTSGAQNTTLHCSDFVSTSGSVYRGLTSYSDGYWTNAGTTSCGAANRLYCFQQANDDPSGAHKKVFVSSVSYNGNLGGVSGADSKCQTLADNQGLGGTYKAWISDTNATTEPNQSFNKATVPYRLVDGTRIADNWTDLTDGTLLTSISLDETGAEQYGQVFTNVTSAGLQKINLSSNTCYDWGSTSGSGYGGFGAYLNGFWTDGGSTSCASSGQLICVEQ